RVINFIKENEYYLNGKINEITGLSENNFKENLIKVLNKQDEKFFPFKQAIEFHLSNTESKDKELKKEVLLYLTKYKTPETRIIRESPISGEAFISYNYIKEDTIYEVGFSYLYYRKFIHEQSIKFFYILLIGSFLVLLGTPLFLSRALIQPLENVLSGLREVKKGNFKIKIPIRVQDEIGFLSSSFNTMVEAIKDGKRRLEDYSENLEEKVKERTSELKNSLDKINELKIQQDRDYFLTSLLITPYINNHVKSKNIEIDFFISQKKKFEFKGVSHEIGGDLCYAQNLKINNKDFVLFINADAMGKSLQGAGGAIVFGSVVSSIIERTNHGIMKKDQSPERWLKNAFIELHKIFLTFDGSMQISAILGLVEEETGVLYYMNAEHPDIVIYRDNYCHYLENQKYFYKLGTSLYKSRLTINLFQLKKNDIIFIGSDGKDDILLNENEEISEKHINDNENEFIETVKKANGDLQKIYEICFSKGKIIDDFSLIKLQYHGEEIDSTGLKNKTLEFYEKKNYSQTIKFGLEYINKNPIDTEFYSIIINSLFEEKRYDSAAYYSEIFRLREPNNIHNLYILVKSHIKLQSYTRAQKIINELERLNFNPIEIQILRNSIPRD
ncbi:MAG: SpoIIE family protein phosphatase, partial [Leptospiraceae bacterium]|nr:SpoIIE family protein phosphatase [Leptospiraceae bacterium]